jgi:hypothetical protein
MTEEKTVFDIDLTWEKINSAREEFKENSEEEQRITSDLVETHNGIVDQIREWYRRISYTQRNFVVADDSSFIVSEDEVDNFVSEVQELSALHSRLSDLQDTTEEMEAHPSLHLATWHIHASLADILLNSILKIRRRISEAANTNRPWYFVDSYATVQEDLYPYVLEMARECYEDSEKDTIVSFFKGLNERLADLISTVTLLPTETELIIDEDSTWAANDRRSKNDHGCQLLGIGTETVSVVFAIKANYSAE